jgi:hypothetical protein
LPAETVKFLQVSEAGDPVVTTGRDESPGVSAVEEVSDPSTEPSSDLERDNEPSGVSIS